jgi:NADH-quinone oxidoreductase subunit G
MTALRGANGVVAAAAFAGDDLRAVADVILPLAPVAESEGSFINLDGDPVGFAPAGRTSGQARPGWKILRRLGELLGLEGFAQVSLNELQSELRADLEAGRAAALQAGAVTLAAVEPASESLFRIGDVPIYSCDALCRRATPLQQTVHAANRFVGLNPEDAQRLGLLHGGKARVRQGALHGEFQVEVSERVPAGGAWVRSGTCDARGLGPASGPVSVEVA